MGRLLGPRTSTLRETFPSAIVGVVFWSYNSWTVAARVGGSPGGGAPSAGQPVQQRTGRGGQKQQQAAGQRAAQPVGAHTSQQLVTQRRRRRPGETDRRSSDNAMSCHEDVFLTNSSSCFSQISIQSAVGWLLRPQSFTF